jgi:choline dehydrogenase
VPDGETAEYDVVIVGAGTAGCVAAARLSEAPSRRVLLIEAGPYYGALENHPWELAVAASFGPSEPGHPLNWSFTGIAGATRRYPLARGKVFGGTSALNGSAYLRATQDDYARWSADGNAEWAEAGVMPYYIRSENDLAFGTQARHGHAGPLKIVRPDHAELTTTARAFADACERNGFPVLADLNGCDDVGVGMVPSTEIRGTRTNTAVAYLEPAINRGNLTILADTTVCRVLVERGQAIGVEALRAGKPRTYRSAEVVLCAGAIKSPHLLMLSGIGPAEHLRAFGIPVVHDNGAVGANFVDHMKFPFPVRGQKQPAPRAEALFHEVALHYTGAGSNGAGDLQIIPPATAMLRAHSESDGSGDGGPMNFTCIQNSPWARGQIRLTSADPFVSPAIVYGRDSRDKTQTRDLARTAAALLGDEAFANLGIRSGELSRETLDDDLRLDDWIGERLGSANHLCASARMGSSNDESAVVDPHGSVYGLQGLRVADLSIVDGVSRGPYATAVMVGEKISSVV